MLSTHLLVQKNINIFFKDPKPFSFVWLHTYCSKQAIQIQFWLWLIGNIELVFHALDGSATCWKHNTAVLSS